MSYIVQAMVPEREHLPGFGSLSMLEHLKHDVQEHSPERVPHVEYLQSLRCHPFNPQMLSALVAASEPSPEAANLT